jgi:hypothetical protein
LEIGYTDSVTRFGETKNADATSILVYAELFVVNHAHEGRSFIPQDTLKIIIGDDEFDAADLDEKISYSSKIEPTLGEIRKCYFELPRRLVTDSFIVRFGEFLSETKDVIISTR